ncbi:d62c87d5-fc19-4d45-87fd-70710b29c00b [Sclerotinia trifoliorum]|uniref:D62c87d5-fc19-4d45-87fd-70710b29c00b n=1 Tax=Sclerotinia trifoliorum TaxID=28548 RepID=A0A8H2ZRY7_9HELO|nr:d62c87d5-fc19-4d45-87fd-70710b29c00b [Sclerotinia trifoliorum]
MAPLQRQGDLSGAKEWEPSHLDNILLNRIIKLGEQDLKQEKAMSEALRRGYDTDGSENDMLKDYVTENWLKDIIFLKDGQKCIIAKDIGLRKDFCYSWYKERIDDQHRKYCIAPHRHALKDIDHTSKNRRAFTRGTRHRSEGEWCLPETHGRHFSKFPPEIIDNILSNLLEISDGALAPVVATSNWKKCFTGSPHYKIHKDGEDIDAYTMTEIGMITQTQEGSLMVLRKVYTSELDATCLRVCKAWKDAGGSLLYRFNCYTFGTNNSTFEGSPPTWMGNKIWRPPVDKPYLVAEDNSSRIFKARIERGIRNIKKRVTIKNLAGWVYHDPFLRFLYTIGAGNAALLHTLQFSGKVRCHQCERGHFCNDCLVESLRIYVPIINAICPNVRKLVLRPEKDGNSFPELEIFKQKLLQFFERDLRHLKYITELVVVDDLSYDSDRTISTAQLAKPTVTYFRERASSSHQ